MNTPLRYEVPVGKIDFADTRFKFRRNFKAEVVEKKRDSISEVGLLNPIKLWRQGDKYTIIAGWQRAMAVISLGLPSIAADVYDGITYHEALMINIADNSLRENLSDYEVASQMHALKANDGYSVEKIAELFHCGVDRVYDMLSTFDMDTDLRNAFENGDLTLYKAVVISRFPVSERSEILRRTLEEGRSTRWLRNELSKRKSPDTFIGASPVDAESAVQARGDHQGSLTHEAVGQSKAGPPHAHEALMPHGGEAAFPQTMQVNPVSENKPVFTTSALFDKLLEWYPLGVLDELWDMIPSDGLRAKFFPKLVEELWKIAKKSESPETLFTRVMKNLSNSEYADVKTVNATSTSAGDPILRYFTDREV
jgi:ParB/RepB/Spo0J family partition protein